MGISKRELLEDYYMDEIGVIIREWNRLNDPASEDEPRNVDAVAFFGEGGEWLTD